MAYQIYVTSLGGVAAQVFNAIAAFFNNASWHSLAGIIIMLAVTMTGFQYALTRNHNTIIKWVAVYISVPLLLIVPRISVTITDITDPLNYHQVDNVPVGLGLPAWLISTISYDLTKLIEGDFHVNDDVSYNNTGMIFGSTLFRQTAQPSVDTQLQGYWTSYLMNCILPDVRVRHKYSYQDLYNAPDIFAFLATHNADSFDRIHMSSNIGGTTVEYPTCKQALPILQKKFKTNALFGLKSLAAMNAKEDAKHFTKYKQAIENTYSYFMNISKSSEQVMMQNLAINAVKNGLVSGAASKNATAAALNYSVTQTEMASTSHFLTLGVEMQKFIPMLQTILFLLVVCTFIPVMCMALIPDFTLKVLKTYVFGLVWICSWSIFYVFLNFIMTSILSTIMTSVSGLYSGVTLSNLQPLKQLTWEYAAITGYLMMFIPYLARMVFTGAASVMSTMATSISSTLSSNAAVGSRGMSQGDINLFNTSTGNHTMNNLSANKHDTDYTNFHGGVKYSLPDGGVENLTRGGQVLFDQSGAVSRQPFDINNRQAISTGLNQSAQSHMREAYAENQSAQSNITSALGKLSQAGNQETIRQFENDSTGNSQQSQYAHAMGNLSSMAEKYGADNVSSFLSTTHFDVGEKGSVGGGFNIGVAKASGEVYENLGHSWNSQNNSSDSTGISADDQKSIRDDWSTIQSYSSSHSSGIDNGKMRDLSNSMRADLSEAQSHMESAQHSYDLAYQENQAANYAQTHDFTMSENMMPQFESYLRSDYGNQQSDYWLHDIANQNTPEFEQAQANFVQQNEQEYMSWYNQHQGNLKNDTMSSVNDKTNQIQSGDSVRSLHETDNQIVKDHAQATAMNQQQQAQQNALPLTDPRRYEGFTGNYMPNNAKTMSTFANNLDAREQAIRQHQGNFKKLVSNNVSAPDKGEHKAEESSIVDNFSKEMNKPIWDRKL